ncbi:MAG: ribose-phosphate diphosphokinase [Candidatus Lokiarchaeota archaeon]|nr:ribose-phosphate diphosphokinase [Candidatus Lokiarchaeota archaeon]
MLKVLGGSSAKHIAYEVSKEMEIDYVKLNHKKFPDGEKYIRIMDEEMTGNSYIIIQSMYKNPDEFLMEYFFLVDVLKNHGAKEIIAFIPYFAYARQDIEFNHGEPVSFKIVANLIETAGTTKLFTFDPHLHRVKSLSDLFSIPAYSVSLLPAITMHIRENYRLDDAIIIGPDEESEQWTKMAADETGLEYDVLEKFRHGDYEIELKPRELDVHDRDIILIDDIISTGGTMAETIKVLKKQGAHKIVAATSHPLLIGDALINLYTAGADLVIASDTIPSPISYIKCAPIIAEILRKMIII